MSNIHIIKDKINNNAQVMDVFSREYLINAWEKSTGKEISQVVGNGARIGANYASAVLVIDTARRLINDFNMDGRVVLKTVKNKQYVIFKNHAGNRSIFTGTRYLADNPKVVDMAIGKAGVRGSVISGARLTIFLIVPINILNHILSDQKSMSKLIGSTAIDLVKVGVASALVGLAATATATLTTLVAGPIVVAIVVGLAASYALDVLDEKFGLTRALIKAFNDAYDNTVGEFGRQIHQADKRMKWQLMNGESVGQGMFY